MFVPYLTLILLLYGQLAMVSKDVRRDAKTLKKALAALKGKYCYELVSGRAVYSGKMDRSYTGKRCQSWCLNSPHGHSYSSASKFTETSQQGPESMQEVASYCRDPDKEGKPWCYTMDAERRWEFCMIPKC